MFSAFYGYHVDNYIQFLTDILAGKIITQNTVDDSDTSTQCIDVRGFKQPFFSD
jgi:hypothetical protein